MFLKNFHSLFPPVGAITHYAQSIFYNYDSASCIGMTQVQVSYQTSKITLALQPDFLLLHIQAE